MLLKNLYLSMDLDLRSREIMQWLVEEYLSTGEPVGSRTLSRRLESTLSAATIRNVMADLTDANLIFAPHTSAGRQPTQAGLRFYVDALMQRGDLSAADRQQIETKCVSHGQSLREVYDSASSVLSGLSSCVGVVLAPKIHKPISQIQFVRIEDKKVLAVLVTRDGMVENRLLDLPIPVTRDLLDQAANYLTERLAGRTVGEIRAILEKDIGRTEHQLQTLTAALVEKGLIDPLTSLDDDYIFVRGQSHLLTDTNALEEVRTLLLTLEQNKNMLDLMEAVQDGQGVQIYIGSENHLFGEGKVGASWSTVIRPYHDASGRIIGATGVIGPTRLNYKRIVPIVDYTAKLMERLAGTVSLEKL